MTGLDVEKDQILEMACLITDCDLNVLAEVGEGESPGPAGTRPCRLGAWACWAAGTFLLPGAAGTEELPGTGPCCLGARATSAAHGRRFGPRWEHGAAAFALHLRAPALCSPSGNFCHPGRCAWQCCVSGLKPLGTQLFLLTFVFFSSRQGPNLIINQPDELLDGMSEWCKEHHGKSGLTKAVKESKISLQQAEYEFLSFVRQQTPPGLCPLAGNSVHADKKFLDKYMPQFMRHLHYRIIDVSTVKELCRRWYPEEYEFAPKKAASHRALDDIRESIKELQFYRDSIFKRKTDEKKRKLIENGESDKTTS
uniref:RNA exonuclease 2 n=1 Tax=Falco tinnunculus TaxID=100819 RepID=A0A8C4U7U7_FALTI